MAQPKTWTATDIEQGTISLRRDAHTVTGNPAVRYEQRYQFVDSGGQVLSEIAPGRLVGEIEFGDIPLPVLSALQTIEQWLYEQCLIKEGMQD